MREAARRAGVGRPILSAVAREQALAAILARRGLPAGAGAGRDPDEAALAAPEPTPEWAPEPTPGYTRALAAFLAELQVRRVTPKRLGRALREWREADGEEPPGARVAEVFAEYEGLLARIGRDDEERGAVRALDALRRSPALWRDAPVLFWGFADFAPLQIDAIETLGAVVDTRVTVSLAYEPGRSAFAGRASTFQSLVALASEHRSLPARTEHYAPGARAALSHLERRLFEPGAPRVQGGAAVRLLEGGDERDELELLAGEIRELLADGVSPEEIVVALRARDGTAELLEEVFEAAEIPYAMPRRRPFGDTGIGRGLIGLLRCAGSGGGAGDLLAWLRAPGVLGSPSRVSAGLEQTDWLERRVGRSGATSAAQARALWEQSHWRLVPIDRLREAADRGGRALIERATRELRWLFRAPRRGRASVLESDELEEARALAAGERALAGLAELAGAAPELGVRDPAGLARILAGVKFSGGERRRAGAVAVLDPHALARAGGARRVHALFLCGLQEGTFPAPARAQPLFAEEERRRLAALADLRLTGGSDGLAGERFLFYEAVSCPRELLVLSWHAIDEDGGPGIRSLFVEDVRDLFSGGLDAEESASSHRAPASAQNGQRPGGSGASRPAPNGHAPGSCRAPRPAPNGHAPGSWRAPRPAPNGHAPGSWRAPRPAPNGHAPGSWRAPRPAPNGHAPGSCRAPRPAPNGPRPGTGRARLRQPPPAWSAARPGAIVPHTHTWSASSLELWIRCPARWLVERMLRAKQLRRGARARARAAEDGAVGQRARLPALGDARAPSGSSPPAGGRPRALPGAFRSERPRAARAAPLRAGIRIRGRRHGELAGARPRWRAEAARKDRQGGRR
jgi:hypothetical protein